MNIDKIQSHNYARPHLNVQIQQPLIYNPYPQIIQPYMYGREPQCVTW
jgi:hypothetical protein